MLSRSFSFTQPAASISKTVSEDGQRMVQLLITSRPLVIILQRVAESPPNNRGTGG